MRKFISLLSLLALATMLLSACGTAAFAQEEDSTPVRTLSVVGSGQVYLTPDIAYVSIGVRTESADAAEAVAENNTKTTKVVAAVKGFGIDEKDIQTTNFSIYPQQVYDDQGNVQSTTYVVENTVRVTVRDLDSIGKLLDTSVGAGANFIYGVQFDVADKVSALSDARKAAVENARLQAEELAETAGVKLGLIQSISVYGGYPVPMYEGMGGGVPRAAAAEVPISPGQLTVTVEVNIVYEIH